MFNRFSPCAIVLTAALLAALSLSTSGCSSEEQATDKLSEKDKATVQATLASLPDEDRELATKQKICPVSGESLGLMGKPVKVDVKGQPVFICCGGCKELLLEKPDEYLAKLGLKPADQQAENRLGPRDPLR